MGYSIVILGLSLLSISVFLILLSSILFAIFSKLEKFSDSILDFIHKLQLLSFFLIIVGFILSIFQHFQ